MSNVGPSRGPGSLRRFRPEMSLRVRLIALVSVLAIAMSAVAFLLPSLALESAGSAVWKERRETAEVGLRREWGRATRDLAVTGPLLERAIAASSAAVSSQWLERALQASGAARGWVKPAQGNAVVERGDSMNFRRAPALEPLLVTARNAGRASGLVLDGPRAAWVEVVGMPGTDAAAVLELPLDSRLARRFAESAGVEVALAGVPVKGGAVVRFGADALAVNHQRLFEAAATVDARRRASDTGDASDSVRLVKLEATDDVVLIGAMASRDVGAGRLLEEYRLAMAIALGAIGLGGILAVAFAASSLRRGILALDRAAREIITGRGQYQPVVRAGRDELAQLSSTFNTMHEAVQQREQRIRQAAYRDPVTRLPTRVLFDERGGAMLTWVRAKQRKASLLLVHVDQLREINDTLGRQAAEQVLSELAERFRGVLRGTRILTREDGKSEPQELSILARTGPYEFAVMLRDCDPVTARNVGMRLADMASKPFRHEGETLGISLRVGVAGYPVHGATIPDLMQSADYALLGAAGELGGVAIFDPAHETERERQLAVQADLRMALERRQLHMVFQPKISLGSGSALMAEALMRWVHPERGPQNPAEFVEFAEKTGFITKLTAWAIDGALRHAAQWSRDGLPMTISVNLSRRDLMNPEFPAQVVAALRQHGLTGKALSFDIPEGVLVNAPAIVKRNMELLSRAGAMFAVDDFGSGFGAIEELQKLPLHFLKIDRRYVSAMCEDARAAIVVRAVVDLAHSLGLQSVAEGVETAQQLALLREMGCDQAQGYYVGRPLTRDDFETWVRHQAAKYGVEGAERRLRPRMPYALTELDSTETIVLAAPSGAAPDAAADGEAATDDAPADT
jgi:diguanylate cyclase (GGDEF)-like protein